MQNIVDSFMIENLDQSKLYDILPSIIPGNKHLEKMSDGKTFFLLSEKEILDRWKKYFESKQVPYIITFSGGAFTLWKNIEEEEKE